MKKRVVSIISVSLLLAAPATVAHADQPDDLVEGPACHGQVIGGMAQYGITPVEARFGPAGWNMSVKDLCESING